MSLKQLTYKKADDFLVISWVTQLKFSCSSNSLQGLFIARAFVESRNSLELTQLHDTPAGEGATARSRQEGAAREGTVVTSLGFLQGRLGRKYFLRL